MAELRLERNLSMLLPLPWNFLEQEDPDALPSQVEDHQVAASVDDDLVYR